MKPVFLSLLASISLVSPSLWALPQDFGDLSDLPLFGLPLALDGRDLTSDFLEPAVWSGDADLPGPWRPAYEVGTRSARHIAAAPYLFGHVPIGVESVYESSHLQRVSIYYLESGTFFGYAPELKDSADGKQMLKDKQRMFRKVFDELEKSLEQTLEEVSGDRGKTAGDGQTRVFQQRFRQYRKGPLTLQLRAREDAYVRVDLRRSEDLPASFLPAALDGLSRKDREAELRKNVIRETGGDVAIRGIPMILQGGRAYCGITTYLMAAQYLGIDMDAATMAAEAGFRYGMGGKKMIEVYNAAAREGGLRLRRATRVDLEKVRESIDEGLPVLVWRRFNSGRNRLHTGQASLREKLQFSADRAFSLPEPDAPDRATWPGPEAPAHASVITGYHPDRNEVIFSESWGEHARDKRMRFEELEGTAYYAFYFSF